MSASGRDTSKPRERSRIAVGLVLAAVALALALLLPTRAAAQVVKDEPRPGASPPVANFHGLVPGVSSAQELIGKLGEPDARAEWYAWRLSWKARGGAEGTDSVWLEGEPESGVVGAIECATPPDGLATKGRIFARVGEPEFHLTYPGGQELLDYASRGVRFIVDAEGATIGATFFPHGWRRVHTGARRRVDLGQATTGRRGEGPSPDPKLRVGVAVIDISPTADTYEREFRIVTPLEARCAVIEQGETRVAIVGADLFGMLLSEVSPIEERLRAAGVDQLVLAMSHDHTAPDTIGIYGHYPKKYVERIQERIVTGCLRAIDDLRRVSTLRVACDDLSLRGGRVEGLIRNARNPGIVDPQLAVVQAVDADSRPIVTFVHFACHVEGIAADDAEISADFPGFMARAIEASTGAPAVFLNGALGGMVTGDSAERTHADAERTGARFAAEVERILGLATPSRTSALRIEKRRIEVPVTNPRFIEFHERAPERRPMERGRIVSEMVHLRIGDAELLTVPGELLPEVSFEILEEMVGYPRMIVGLANDQLGYMIPVYDFRAGFYEESMSVGPAIAPVVRETGLRLIRAASDVLPRP